jgi:hypothetical protein
MAAIVQFYRLRRLFTIPYQFWIYWFVKEKNYVSEWPEFFETIINAIDYGTR